jgi:hypothetical protein
VDLGIVHPIPLAVADIVAEFHVLDDFRECQSCDAQTSSLAGAADEKHSTGRDFERSLKPDRPMDVLRVACAPGLFDAAANGVQFLAEGFDVGTPQMGVPDDVGNGHESSKSWNGISLLQTERSATLAASIPSIGELSRCVARRHIQRCHEQT